MKKDIPAIDTYPYYDEFYKSGPLLRRLFYRLLPVPLHVYFSLRYEIYLFFLRLATIPTPLRFRGKTNLLVNIAPGLNGKKGWINIDAIKAPNINCLYDSRKKLPFQDNSVKAIFCEHFFEHMDYSEEVPRFLSECHRVLQSDGVIRISVPNAEEYLKAYCNDDWDHMTRLRPLLNNRTDACYKCSYRTKMELVNMVFRQAHRHRFAYDYETLEFVLDRYGFSVIERKEFNVSALEELKIDEPARASESLYVEARK